MRNSLRMIGLVVGLMCSTESMAQCGNNDNALIHKAIVAARANGCLPCDISNLEIGGNVETISICFVSGFIKRVTLYSSPRCTHPPCPKFPSRLVATVEFGCDGQVTSVVCID